MKTFTRHLLSLMAVCAFATGSQAVEEKDAKDCHHHSVTWEMRKEMFLAGTFHVQDENGQEEGVFLLNYMPGAEPIVHDALEHLKHAKDTFAIYLQGHRFWENKVWDSITSGVRWTWESNRDYGVGSIPSDFKSLFKDFNSVSVKEFGGLGRKALDVAGCVASIVCRTVASAGVTAAGLLGTTIVPLWHLVAPACFGIGQAAFCGVGLPVAKMVYQAGAWTFTQVYMQTPDEKSNITVTWVPATKKNPESPKTEL